MLTPMKDALLSAWVPCLVLLGVSCASMRPTYEIVITNSTGVAIDDAHVFWEGFESAGGSMFPRTSSGDHFIQTPLPSRVMVRWQTRPDSIIHREGVAVPEGVPRRFRGTLHFEILEDGRVEVRVDS